MFTPLSGIARPAQFVPLNPLIMQPESRDAIAEAMARIIKAGDFDLSQKLLNLMRGLPVDPPKKLTTTELARAAVGHEPLTLPQKTARRLEAVNPPTGMPSPEDGVDDDASQTTSNGHRAAGPVSIEGLGTVDARLKTGAHETCDWIKGGFLPLLLVKNVQRFNLDQLYLWAEKYCQWQERDYEILSKGYPRWQSSTYNGLRLVMETGYVTQERSGTGIYLLTDKANTLRHLEPADKETAG